VLCSIADLADCSSVNEHRLACLQTPSLLPYPVGSPRMLMLQQEIAIKFHTWKTRSTPPYRILSSSTYAQRLHDDLQFFTSKHPHKNLEYVAEGVIGYITSLFRWWVLCLFLRISEALRYPIKVFASLTSVPRSSDLRSYYVQGWLRLGCVENRRTLRRHNCSPV
jgi:hypothetical protein